MDVSLAAAALRRTGAGGDGRPDAGRIALALRAVLPVVEASPVQGDLARELKSLVQQRSVVHLVLPPDGGAAQLDTGLRRFPLSESLRDALLTSVRGEAAPSAPAAPVATAAGPALAASGTAGAAPEPQLSLAARALAAGAAPGAALGEAESGIAANGPAFTSPPLLPAALSAAATGGTSALSAQALAGAVRDIARQVAREDAPPTVQWRGSLAVPGDAGLDAGALASRLRATVERSGLFFEAHLAQWAQGERSSSDLSDELRRMGAATRGAEAAAASWSSPVPGGAERVAAQIELMQAQALNTRGEVWQGQSMQLAVRREGSGEAATHTPASPVFIATLTLDLPHLGPVEVQLRLAGDVLALRAVTRAPRVLRDDLPRFAEQLAARGLRPAALQIVAEGP